MTNYCKTCPVSTGTHKPAEAVHQIAEPSSQTPEDAQIQALMRKHRIWIEHSTLFENDEPERELRAVQAEEHQFNAFVQDLIAATQLAAAPQAVQPAVPDGWKLAPVEPTQAMIDAMPPVDEVGYWAMYEAAIACAPEAPAHPAEGVPAQDAEAKIEELLALARIMVRAALDADNKTQVQEIKAAIESEVAFERAVRAALASTQPAAQGLDAAKLLAEKHTGMKVDYRGLLGQVRRAIKHTSGGHEEMLRQLEGHITELGQRWYAGDTAVVDELLQLYCVERQGRADLAAQAKQGGA